MSWRPRLPMAKRPEDCPHAESLYGRCTTCGMTWKEQALAGLPDLTSDIETHLDSLDPDGYTRPDHFPVPHTIETDEQWDSSQ